MRLLSELKGLTTYAPQFFTNTINTDTTLGINAIRDTNAPDLGYHYAPLDYVVSGLLITNAALYLTNGAAVGIDYGATNWGMIFDTGKLISQGSPLAMNKIVRAHCVQENSSGNPETRAVFYDKGNDGLSHENSELRLRFTEMSALAQDGNSLYMGKHWSAFEWLHSQIYNAYFYIDASKGSQVYGITNTLVDGSEFIFTDSGSSSVLHMFNNLFRNENVEWYDGHTSWLIRDNLFDTCTLNPHSSSLGSGYNGFYQTTDTIAGSGDKNLDTLAYQTGPLGCFYLPSGSSLSDQGSRYATNAGLCHFTTTTNQTKEADSQVDIGLHYVALAANGAPCDYDSDSVPDYVEDWNGNGAVDTGEFSWISNDTDGDGVPDLLEVLQGRNPNVQYAVPEANNEINLRVFTPLE